MTSFTRHFAVSWLNMFGAYGRPTAKTMFCMLDSLRAKHADIDKFLESASDYELTSAMIAVHEVYDGMELAKRMVEKEYAR